MGDKKAKKPGGIVQKIKDDNVKGAQRELLEELFYDIYVNRKQVYLVNFFRGISFGLGSVLGGTVLLVITIWLLTQFGNLVPPLSDFIGEILDTLQQRRGV